METTMKKREKSSSKSKVMNVRTLVMIGMLGAVAVVLMLISVPVWFAPSFYKLDVSEVPILIGGFALGPVAGVAIAFIKIILNLLINGTDTAFIGEIANFIMACSIVVPSAIIYKRKKTWSGAIFGLVVGTICLIVASSLLNIYVLLPFYAKAFKIPMDGLIAAGSTINKGITDLKTFIILAVAPFNLLKGGLSSLITMALYKRISPIIKNNH